MQDSRLPGQDWKTFHRSCQLIVNFFTILTFIPIIIAAFHLYITQWTAKKILELCDKEDANKTGQDLEGVTSMSHNQRRELQDPASESTRYVLVCQNIVQL